MATILGGIGTSHVPTIGMAFDRARQADHQPFDHHPTFALGVSDEYAIADEGGEVLIPDQVWPV